AQAVAAVRRGGRALRGVRCRVSGRDGGPRDGGPRHVADDAGEPALGRLGIGRPSEREGEKRRAEGGGKATREHGRLRPGGWSSSWSGTPPARGRGSKGLFS